MQVEIKTPAWGLPYFEPIRYKGLKGGRGSGKSHFFGDLSVETMLLEPNESFVCIREIQKSLQFSAKKLIEDKINKYNLYNNFEITKTEIRNKSGSGVMIFQGMQDHTAESIKSLEGFKYAWVEEAQSLSARSLQLLRPTIRKEGSEIWFSWNPDQPTDAIDLFFQQQPENSIIKHVNLLDNPFAPETLIKEMESDRLRMSPEDFNHVWNGAYNQKSDAIVFKNKYEVNYFEPAENWSVLYGLDFGFSQDPTAGIEVYIHENTLYIYREAGKIGLELDDTAEFLIKRLPNIENFTLRADNARPESISYLKRNGLPRIKGEAKLKIQDGITHMRKYDKIVIHPRCKETIKEFGLYQYKQDKRTGDILPDIVDKFNHYIDAIRYALFPVIKKKKEIIFVNM